MPTAPAPFRAVVGVALMFASNGTMFASLLPWYPTIAAELRLSPTVFGVTVACFAVGGVLASALPAPLARRFGTSRVSVCASLIIALAVLGAGWAPGGILLAATLLAAGIADAVADVSQNVAGMRVQVRFGRSVISSMHAMWSLGAVAGAAVGTAAAASGLDIRVHLMISGAVGLVVVVVGASLTRGSVGEITPTASTATAAPLSRLVVLRTIAPLAVLALCCTVVEDVANNWSGIAGVEMAGLEPATAGTVFTVVVVSQCAGRFSGDVMINRWGRAAVARGGSVLVVVGGLLVVFTAAPWMLFAGFALVGFGCATLIPSAFAAAAEVRGISDGAGVTVVGWIMRVGFLCTSPVVGIVTDLTQLRYALALLVVAGLAGLFLSKALRQPSPGGRASASTSG